MPDAHQKRHAQLPFKRHNTLADCGSRKVLQACRLGDRAAIHHGNQAFEVAGIHKNFFRSRIK
jgi:hypothetical protein